MSVPMMQDSAPDALKGGNNFVDQRRGNEASQRFPLTGAKAKQVDNDQPASSVCPNIAAGAASRTPEDVSGMNAGSGREFTAKRVDQVDVNDFGRHMPADKLGDVAKASNRQAAEGQGGPRSPRGQFPNGRADTAGKGGSFGNEHSDQSYPTTDNGD